MAQANNKAAITIVNYFNTDTVLASKDDHALNAECQYILSSLEDVLQATGGAHNSRSTQKNTSSEESLVSHVIMQLLTECDKRIILSEEMQAKSNQTNLKCSLTIANIVCFETVLEVKVAQQHAQCDQVKHDLRQCVFLKCFLFLTNLTKKCLKKRLNTAQLIGIIEKEFRAIASLNLDDQFGHQNNANNKGNQVSLYIKRLSERINRFLSTNALFDSLTNSSSLQKWLQQLLPLQQTQEHQMSAAQCEAIYQSVMQCWHKVCSSAELKSSPSPSNRRKTSSSKRGNSGGLINGNLSRYSVLAAIVATNDHSPSSSPRVLALGTGNKFASAQWMLEYGGQGTLVQDYHAEVVARRAFQLYLYDTLDRLVSLSADVTTTGNNNGQCNQPDDLMHWEIIEPIDGQTDRWRKHAGVKLHLYVNTSPCGDSRTPQSNFSENNDKRPGLLRVKCGSREQVGPLPMGYRFTMDGIQKHQQTPVFQSCSDKILKWNFLGLQGALLTRFIEPLYLDSIVITDQCSLDHAHRAFYGRVDQHLLENKLRQRLGPNSGFRLNKPLIGHHTRPRDEDLEEEDKENRKSPKKIKTSHNWYQSNHSENEDVASTSLEVIHYRKDAIAIHCNKEWQSSCWSRLSKRSMCGRFVGLCDRKGHRTDQYHPSIDHDIRGYYRGAKRNCIDYFEAFQALKETLEHGNQGKWSHAPVQLDLFPLRENVTFDQIEENSYVGR